MESHGLDLRHKATCGHTVVERRVSKEKCGMVERYESPEHDDRLDSDQPNEMETQMVWYNQEADHLANLETEGKRKITIERLKNTEE